MLKGELVNEICREEPVCSKYSEGLVVVNVGARKHVVRRDALCEESLRVGKHPVRRDASCGETLRERNRFVCILVLGKTRTAFYANLWGIRNGCVCLRALSL